MVYLQVEIFKMASVGPRLGRELSFTGRIWKAFHEWYIYACGYRQLGKFPCRGTSHLIEICVV